MITELKLLVVDKDRLIARVSDPVHTATFSSFSGIPEFHETGSVVWPAGRAGIFVDPRDREEFAKSHRTGSINIPGDEFAVRAAHELKREQPLVLTCANLALNKCRSFARTLKGLGYA